MKIDYNHERKDQEGKISIHLVKVPHLSDVNNQTKVNYDYNEQPDCVEYRLTKKSYNEPAGLRQIYESDNLTITHGHDIGHHYLQKKGDCSNLSIDSNIFFERIKFSLNAPCHVLHELYARKIEVEKGTVIFCEKVFGLIPNELAELYLQTGTEIVFQKPYDIYDLCIMGQYEKSYNGEFIVIKALGDMNVEGSF